MLFRRKNMLMWCEVTASHFVNCHKMYSAPWLNTTGGQCVSRRHGCFYAVDLHWNSLRFNICDVTRRETSSETVATLRDSLMLLRCLMIQNWITFKTNDQYPSLRVCVITIIIRWMKLRISPIHCNILFSVVIFLELNAWLASYHFDLHFYPALT